MPCTYNQLSHRSLLIIGTIYTISCDFTKVSKPQLSWSCQPVYIWLNFVIYLALWGCARQKFEYRPCTRWRCFITNESTCLEVMTYVLSVHNSIMNMNGMSSVNPIRRWQHNIRIASILNSIHTQVWYRMHQLSPFLFTNPWRSKGMTRHPHLWIMRGITQTCDRGHGSTEQMTSHDNIKEWIACCQTREESKYLLFKLCTKVGSLECTDDEYLLLLVKITWCS